MTKLIHTSGSVWTARLAYLGMVFLLARYGFAQVDHDQLERRFSAAVQRHQSGDIAGAIKEYQAILAVRPDWIDCRSNLGAALAHEGRYREAIDQYSRALALHEDNLPVRFNLGLAYYKALMLPQAALEFERVLKEQPSNRSALMLLSDCDLRTGAFRKAIDLLSPHGDEWADDHGFDYLLGSALLRANELRQAQIYIDRIMKGGESAESSLLMGTAHLMALDYPKAVKEFARAIELNPKLPTAHSFYGRALLQTGDRDGALKAFSDELAIDPNDFDSCFYTGVVLKEDQEYDESLQYLLRAQNIRPGELNVAYYIGGLYVATGKIKDARDILEKVVRQAPDFVEAHVLLATVYYRLKLKQEGDRERAVIRKLNAEEQARAPEAGDTLGPAYRGEKTVPGVKPPESRAPAP